MASLQQVIDALVVEARAAIAGIDHPATVYAGWPTQANLAEVVAKGIRSHVSVYALPGERNTTRFARDPVVQQPAMTVGSPATLISLLRQQEKHFMVSVWAPAPDVRETLAEAIDARLGTMDRLPLPDFPGRIRYQSTYEEEPQDRLQVFRLSLTYSVEWARTEMTPATRVVATRFTLEP